MSEVIAAEQLPTEPQLPSTYRRISQGLSRVLMAYCLPGSAHFLSGKRLTEPPFFKTMSEKDDGYGGYVRLEEMGFENAGVPLPITLGQDEYFLLGDNSERSLDSRVKGAVHRKDIIGKVVRLYYPFSRLRDL
ncbi:hypothetical protein FACS189427_01590 [Planctomycetales bacterium]|nr:hypothetical protein FACS189427_01590 [Planctomycetales bacterium]